MHNTKIVRFQLTGDLAVAKREKTNYENELLNFKNQPWREIFL
jgi:hypothetical protein